MLSGLPFGQVWVVDFEYHQPDGGLPDPLCVVAWDLLSGARVERWLPQDDPGPCPYDVGPGSVCVGHNFSAEALCHIQLGWPQPTFTLDTYAEIKAWDNGKPFAKAGLLDAAMRLGVCNANFELKERGRSIAIRGRNYAEQHKGELIDYCVSDVEVNARLLAALLPKILRRKLGLGHALMRGSYMVALASVIHAGVPIDVDLLTRLQARWPDIRRLLIDRVDTGRTDCYVDYTFNKRRFSGLLERLGLLEAWPRTEKLGWPSTEEEVFKDRARGHSVLWPLFQLHVTLERLKKLTLHVGSDGRHRAVGDLGGQDKRSAGLYPFGTRTGRNAPKGFVFQSAAWVRSLIKPNRAPCWSTSTTRARKSTSLRASRATRT